MKRDMHCNHSGINGFSATAQQLSYSDPAISYQRILLEKSGRDFQQIGNFKVTGTSFYTEATKGNIYTPKEGRICPISYNTYNQQVHVLQQGQDKELVMALKKLILLNCLLMTNQAHKS